VTTSILYVLLGIAAGVFGGLVGIGGGIVVVPALVFLFGMSQHQAQGTTLATLVPPVGLLAAWAYYRNGYVNLQAAGLIAAGFIIGSLLGARLAVTIPSFTLEKIFGAVMVLIGLRMLFSHW
jgi:uncharacterized membrane protein YfcA